MVGSFPSEEGTGEGVEGETLPTIAGPEGERGAQAQEEGPPVHQGPWEGCRERLFLLLLMANKCFLRPLPWLPLPTKNLGAEQLASASFRLLFPGARPSPWQGSKDAP